MSDPTLDFSKMIPDVETETEVLVYDVTDRQTGFSYLVYGSFQEVQSKVELLSHFLDCTGGVILVSGGILTLNGILSLFCELLQDVKVLTKLTHNSVFSFMDCRFFREFRMLGEDSILYKLLDLLNCLQKPLRITDNSEFLRVEDFLMKFRSFCFSFEFILRFRNGQCQFYIIKLHLDCDDHARIFTESTTISVPSGAAGFCSEKSLLKFLSSLSCDGLTSQTVEGLGAVIGNCKHLSRIELLGGNDTICYLLEQVRSPSKCSVKIGSPTLLDDQGYGAHLTSVGAVQLASLLSKFNNVIALHLDLEDCCAAAVDTLVANITHKTLNELLLFGSLTPAASEALGRSLSEMSSLQVLVLFGFGESVLEAEEMEALFGGFKKAMPLCELTISGFSVTSLSPLIKCLPFFADLRKINLEGLNIDEHDQCRLLKSFGFLTKLQVGTVEETFPTLFHYYTSMDDKMVDIHVTSLTPALAAMLVRMLPELSYLESLEFSAYGSILKAEKMEALFGGFNKTMPLHSLMITGFYERGGLAPLFRSFRFFPNLLNLTLNGLDMDWDEHDLRGLLESFQFIPNLQKLDLSHNRLGHAVTSIVPHVIHLKKLQYLYVLNTGNSEEDLNYVRNTVQAALSELNVITKYSRSLGYRI